MTEPSGRVGVAGLGLIGGSIGLAAQSAGLAVIGYDASPDHARRALRLGLVQHIVPLDELVSCDATFVAVPPGQTVALASALLRAGAPVVTDTSSVKAPVVAALGAHPNFVGGHPMAGSHESGPDAARPALFADATWALTPGAAGTNDALDAVRWLVRRLGAHPVVLDASDHDRAVAFTSHMTHMVAAALSRAVAGAGAGAARLVGSGFETTTRVAGGPAALWTEIATANRDELRTALRDMRAELDDLDRLLLAEDAAALRRWLGGAGEGRREVLVARAALRAEAGESPSAVHAA